MMNHKGFTLVELMIVVAIIGILAAIAIPNFVNMQYRAKRAEVPANVDGIKTAELAYEASFDQFIHIAEGDAHPRDIDSLDKQQVTWTTGTDFDTLGWGPDGKVRGNYYVNGSDNSFTAAGACDVDDNDDIVGFFARQDVNIYMKGAPDIY